MIRREPDTTRQPISPWPHRLAWVLACATFFLLYVGGSVTTYNAGMAIPDWPTTEGAWFYPVGKWLAADWDLFLQHGHRMLAQAVGLITIALAVTLWRLDTRKWMRWLAVAAVAGVVFQGVLGGLRVRGDELVLAKVHGSTGPLFFALTAALVALTSTRWQQGGPARAHPAARPLHRLATVCVLALYVEIVLSVPLRHVSLLDAPGWFVLWVWLKLIATGLTAVGVLWLFVHVARRVNTEAMVVRRAQLLVALFVAQLLLGAGTWVTNLGWPLWFREYFWPMVYTVVAEGRLQAVTTTVHAAAGSLNLVVALSLALWSRRLLKPRASVKGTP
ncbi:MAG: COX15/CtaA family protein [Planctomycetota bacterium]